MVKLKKLKSRACPYALTKIGKFSTAGRKKVIFEVMLFGAKHAAGKEEILAMNLD
jgi:hypothetical protein